MHVMYSETITLFAFVSLLAHNAIQTSPKILANLITPLGFCCMNCMAYTNIKHYGGWDALLWLCLGWLILSHFPTARPVLVSHHINIPGLIVLCLVDVKKGLLDLEKTRGKRFFSKTIRSHEHSYSKGTTKRSAKVACSAGETP